jgi:PAS domain S-box-containing protein
MAIAQILVVEDELLVAEDIRRKLRRSGYEVSAVVTTGQEAIQAALELRPSLVLMDIELPGEISGVEAAAAIGSRLDIPVVYLTAHSDDKTLAEAKVTGPFGYLLKPFDLQELRSTLEMALYRHEQQRKLKESEQRYRSLFDGVPVGLYRTTPDGQILAVNRALANMLGYLDADALLTANLTEWYVDPEDRHRWQVLMERHGAVRGFEARWRRRDGYVIWVRESAHAVCSASGRVLHYEGSVEDMTDRKTVEEALRESEERYRAVSETISDYAYATRVEPDGARVHEWVTESFARITGYSREDIMSHGGLIDLVHPDDAPAVQERADTLLSGRPHVSRFRLITKEGAIRWMRDFARPIWDRERRRITHIFGAAQDITEQVLAEEALLHSLEETARAESMLLALSQAAQTVQRARTPAEVYRTIGEEVAHMGYQAIILTLAGDRRALIASHMTYEPALVQMLEERTGLSAQGYTFPLEPDGHFQQMIAQGGTTLVERPADYLVEALPDGIGIPATQLAAVLGMEQAILATMTVGGHLGGLLVVTGSGLTEADVPAVTGFANQAAIALENARLLASVHEQRERLRALGAQVAEAEEAERRRLARELHDRVGQNLTALGINLNLARAQLQKGESAAALVLSRLEDAVGLVEETTERVRDVMADLRPPLLDDYGLVTALRWLGEQVAARTGIPIEVQGEELDPRLSGPVENSLFRIVQEALTNAAKHAQASHVAIIVEEANDGRAVRLTVADDGVGFEPASAPLARVDEHHGWGLLSMTERAEAVGGSCHIRSRPGKGTKIVVQVARPLEGGS